MYNPFLYEDQPSRESLEFYWEIVMRWQIIGLVPLIAFTWQLWYQLLTVGTYYSVIIVAPVMLYSFCSGIALLLSMCRGIGERDKDLRWASNITGFITTLVFVAQLVYFRQYLTWVLG